MSDQRGHVSIEIGKLGTQGCNPGSGINNILHGCIDDGPGKIMGLTGVGFVSTYSKEAHQDRSNLSLRGLEGCLLGSLPFLLLVWMVFNRKQVRNSGMSIVDTHCNPINLQPGGGGQNDGTGAFPTRL